MKSFHGIPVSPGIGEGKALVFREERLAIPKYDIVREQVSFEFERFIRAGKEATSDLEKIKTRTVKRGDTAEQKFLDSHILMLNDPEFIEQISRNLSEQKKNVEWVLLNYIEEMTERLQASEDTYMRERAADIHDIAQRIMNHLLYRERISMEDISEEVVVIAHNLLPSDAIGMNRQMVKGVATDIGGKTSHTAIIARAFEIPAVLGLGNITKNVDNGNLVIVDGNNGQVIVNPDKKTRSVYVSKQERWKSHELALHNLHELPAETRDGKYISLDANIEVPSECTSVREHGSNGIGLFRSEFLYLMSAGAPTETEQFEAYKRVLVAMKGRSVTIRTLDLGGDKQIPGFKVVDEPNPILGWRAVRFLLARPEIFKIQLRALYRSSMHGNLRIMFPMISGVSELESCLNLVDEVKNELSKEGVPFRDDVPMGIMVEIPSAALTSDILATKVDFFSIGTNDLIQYTLAVDRGNERIAYLYKPFHPSVLRLIQMIVENGHNHGISVGMCGEMAGDRSATVLLIGSGLDELSMSAFMIPEIKKIIRSLTLAEAEEMLGHAMEIRTYHEINAFVKDWMGARFDLEA